MVIHGLYGIVRGILFVYSQLTADVFIMFYKDRHSFDLQVRNKELTVRGQITQSIFMCGKIFEKNIRYLFTDNLFVRLGMLNSCTHINIAGTVG